MVERPFRRSVLIGAMLVTCGFLQSCGASNDSSDDARVRHNERHVALHYDALGDEPIASVRVENGAPKDLSYASEIDGFFFGAVIGADDDPARCTFYYARGRAIIGDSDGIDIDAHTGRVVVKPCGEHSVTTLQIEIRGLHFAVRGHLEDYRKDGDADPKWGFVVDKILAKPAIAELDGFSS